MDVSAVKVNITPTLKIEKLNPSLKIGGDNNSQNLSVTGNLTINQIYVGTASPDNPDLIAQKVEELTSQEKIEDEDSKITIVVSPFMGIVKSPELPGTRIHLEFAVTNEHDLPKVINGVYVKINNGLVHFKKFFKVNTDSSREPDFTVRFPIIINARGVARLPVEFENIEQPLIKLGELKAQLFVLIGDKTVASKEFTLGVNEAMFNTLKNLQEVATQEKAPLIFDAMLKI